MNKSLPTKSEIKSNLINVSDFRISCVYFLVDNDEIVYVGQTNNLYSRIFSHLGFKNKVFNRFYYFVCEQDELDDIESYYIQLYKPKYNTADNKTKDQIMRASRLGWNGNRESCKL